MSTFDPTRRGLLSAAVIAASLPLAPAFAQSATPSAAPPAMPPLKTVRTDLLEIAYAEYGPATGSPVILLHGWPYDIHAFAEVAPILAAKGHRVIVP